ncbi:hypothetical protein ACGFRB_16575 [Streptomyces sp. NPDC048718]|uniref:hypothetical protein n=1 Tax=Streptomyces sp. NPDC048718 TaxID=3365587 RepID=UPI0037204F76
MTVSRGRAVSAVLALAALCTMATSACASEETTGSTPHISKAPGQATTSASAVQPADTAVPNAAQLKAEETKDVIDAKLTRHVTSYGEGTTSPCRPSADTLFGQECFAAVTSIDSIAEEALARIEGEPGFITLRRVSTSTVAAARGYVDLKCSNAPVQTATRAKCVEYGSSVAQASADLRDGLRLALAGK